MLDLYLISFLGLIFYGIVFFVLILHATMAGVILAMTIPERGKIGRKYVRPMQHWEHYLSNWVSFVIVPILLSLMPV